VPIDLLKFFSKIEIDQNDCWNRTINSRPDGYTRVHIDKKRFYAHRFIYQYYYGKIDSKLSIDHLCRNPSCVNPIHLELVTRGENVKRGINAKRENTHCPQGHEYNKENTYYYPKFRRCKICLRRQVKEYKLRKNC